MRESERRVLQQDQAANCRSWSMPDVTGAKRSYLKASDYTDELNQLKSSTEQKAYEAGMQKGLQAAQAEITRLKNEFTRAAELLDAPLSRIDAELEATLMQVIQYLTQQCLAYELTIAPEKIKKMLANAMQLLSRNEDKMKISAHPDDIETISSSYDDIEREKDRIDLIADESLSRGELKLETNKTKIDTTIQAQLYSFAEKLLHEGDDEK